VTVRISPSRSTRTRTAAFVLPSAIRMPISFVR
jgi:hypothetical protein